VFMRLQLNTKPKMKPPPTSSTRVLFVVSHLLAPYIRNGTCLTCCKQDRQAVLATIPTWLPKPQIIKPAI
jgi:hypothetical protein